MVSGSGSGNSGAGMSAYSSPELGLDPGEEELGGEPGEEEPGEARRCAPCRRGGHGIHRGYRRDGFTPERKKACVAALADYGTIADACRVAGISTTSFYRHEKKDPAFRSQCEAARAKAASNLEILAWERAVTGIEEPIICYGKTVGTRRKRSDMLFKLILQAANPEKYGHPLGRSGNRDIAELRRRIEAELRPKIEAELRAQGLPERRMSPAEGMAARRELEAMLSDFNRRMGGDG